MVILSREAYDRWRGDETWTALSRMSPSESLAVGMALWTSTVAATSAVPPEPRHLSFARQLGVSAGQPETVRTANPR